MSTATFSVSARRTAASHSRQLGAGAPVQPAQRLVPVHRGEGWQPVGVGPGKPQELAGFALTDNRKDASLQSGHLNDFAQVGLLRGALYAAAGAAGPAGLGREVLTGGRWCVH